MTINKKKRGSSLMMVVIMFAILSVLGMSIIAMTSNDYYRKVSETKKLQNLYGAESGLDISYNILAKNFEAGVVYANKAVEYKINEEEANGSLSKNQLETLKKETFKESFNNFIDSTLDECIEKSLIVSINNYKTGLRLDSLLDASGNPNADNYGYLLINKVDQTTGTEITADVTAVKKNADSLTINAKENDSFDIVITSRFAPNTEEARKISAEYKINVPEYGFYLKYEDISMEIHPILNKTIAVDGDMLVSADTNIKGDIYVKGSDVSSITDFTYDKYKGGVEVIGTGFDIGKTNFDVIGDIVTTKSLKLKEFSDASVNGNVFASSVALGRTSDIDSISTNSSFTNIPTEGKGMYLSNDLAINGDNISANINNFYGINDISINNGNQYSGDQSKAIDSSSIILNSNNNVSLKINTLAYICGTAYINNDENEKYQTGESVAFKGNYIAYSDTLGKEDVKLDYYKPLQLISKINGSDELVIEKAKHFKEYWENKAFDNVVNVELPTETYSAGAYVTNNTNNTNNKVQYEDRYKITSEFEKDNIFDLRKEYINQVYYFGDCVNFKDGSETDKLYNYFPFSPLTKATVQSEIKFDNLVNKNEIDNEGNRVVFNNDLSKTIVIEGSTNENEIKEIKGLIITKGNIVITGKVKFTGAIFAGGNITFNKAYSDSNSIIICGNNLDVTSNSELNTKNIIIEKDLDLVRCIVAKNYNVLKNVIQVDGDKEFPIAAIKVTQTDVNSDNATFAVKEYIEKGTWKIENAN